MTTRYITSVSRIPKLSAEEKNEIGQVEHWFSFKASEYYLSLIDWSDPFDPIRRLIIPDPGEIEEEDGDMDPSGESTYTVASGLQHKYARTGLLLVSDQCGGLCRYCFRKRLFVEGADEVSPDVTEGIRYIRKHPEVTNVLLTGGDPLMLPTTQLREIIEEIRRIDHVQIIRIGSKMPAYNPMRISEDKELLALLKQYSLPEKRIYLMSQFTHPREITSEAEKAINALLSAGVMVLNQTPILRGINDSSEVLAELFQKLSFMGVSPYYIFQCRPTHGNHIYAVPIEESYRIFEEARSTVSGIAKRARFVMSHATGKIEITACTKEYVVMKYHQAADPEEMGKVVVCRRNPSAYWFDDYVSIVDECLLSSVDDRRNDLMASAPPEADTLSE
ncbi:KamA family radical SAM protein [Methanocalculus taiwanensis]|uniref:KamA family radical SAM protein n=1 Tax=Methanocalculus taiwanensis TaxID=106207 RepID=A0ABD4TL87_9EURY|nr:KamA family radical SAM protein [Methanocalculus taiwanensis]MCQ1538514.1 KamA family radical SAM protein [Methanocalculus taiwanensis]